MLALVLPPSRCGLFKITVNEAFTLLYFLISTGRIILKKTNQNHKPNPLKKKKKTQNIDSITGIKLWARLEMKSIIGSNK